MCEHIPPSHVHYIEIKSFVKNTQTKEKYNKMAPIYFVSKVSIKTRNTTPRFKNHSPIILTVTSNF